MTKTELIKAYHLADSKGKALLKSTHDKDSHKSVLATIEMNNYTHLKNYILAELGRLEIAND